MAVAGIAAIAPSSVANATQWSPAGAWGSGVLNGPLGIDVDPNTGDVWVTNGHANTVTKHDASGNLLLTVGGFGTGPTQFNLPSAVAVAANGDIYVNDIGNSKVKQFTSSGVFVRSWGSSGTGPGQFNNHRGIDVAPNGDVYVADGSGWPSTLGRVQRFSSTGTYLGTPVSFSGFAFGVGIDPNGDLWVTDQANGRVMKTTITGTPIFTLAGFGQPIDVVFDGRGQAHITNFNTNEVRAYTLAGTYVDSLSFGTYPHSLAIDGAGRLLVGEVHANQIEVFDPPDTTPPTITVTAPADGASYPQGSTVQADYACSDDRSLATCTGDVPSGTAIDTSTPGTFSFTVTASDAAGNPATVTTTYTITDTTLPTVSIVAPVDGGTYDLGATVLADFTCTDNVAIATCTGTVANASTIDTSTVGTGSLTVTAVDTAGLVGAATATYDVTGTLAAGLGLTGSIVSIPSGFTVSIVDEPAPDGVTLTVTGSGTEKVQLSVCGGFTVRLSAGSEVTLTCGSVIADVTTGTAEIVAPGGSVAMAVGAGGTAELEENGDAANLGTTPITVTVGATTQTVAPGETAAWQATGFGPPVDMGGVWNTVKAGATVPLKFEVFHGSTELTDPAVVASIVPTRVSCTGGSEDTVEELVTTGATVLHHDGEQFIQAWKLPSTRNTCYRLTMTTTSGTSLTALFKLR
jgi:hypothetical protein